MKKKYLFIAAIAASALLAIIISALLYFTSTPAWVLVERIDSDDTVSQNSVVALTDETLANYPKLEEGIAIANEEYEKNQGITGQSVVVMASNSEGNEIVSMLSGNASSLPSIYPPASSERFWVSNDEALYSVSIVFGYDAPAVG